MKFKYSYIYSALLISSLSVTITSCHKQLDQQPTTQKELTNFLRNEVEVEEYVNAVYGMLQWNGTYKLYFPAMAEISSDNTFDEVPANDGQMYGQLDLFQVVPTNDLHASVWRDHYKTIQGANVVLNRINDVAFDSEEIKNARKGEMMFIRSLMYFNLVRAFGDVPLVTKETTDPFEYFGQGRTVTTEVYAQIIKDLETAIDLLPMINDKVGKARKTAAQTLLGKVYLTQKEWAKAKTALEAVVSSNQHELVAIDKLFGIANENNAEVIFDVQFAAAINGNAEGSNMQQQFSPSGTLANAKGHNLPTKELFDLYDNADKRKQQYVAITDNNIPYSLKLTRPTHNPADGGSNFIVLRYADVLLMLAEIEAQLGNPNRALDYLNPVRERAGLGVVTDNNKEVVLEKIALERRLELVNEGHRWFDLIRYGTAVEVMNQWFATHNMNIVINQNHLLQPIPQNQIDTDPAMVQNPGY